MTIRLDGELAERWDEFIWREGKRVKNRRIGNELGTLAFAEFLHKYEHTGAPLSSDTHSEESQPSGNLSSLKSGTVGSSTAKTEVSPSDISAKLQEIVTQLRKIQDEIQPTSFQEKEKAPSDDPDDDCDGLEDEKLERIAKAVEMEVEVARAARIGHGGDSNPRKRAPSAYAKRKRERIPAVPVFTGGRQ